MELLFQTIDCERGRVACPLNRGDAASRVGYQNPPLWQLPLAFLVSRLIVMTLFLTATAVSPAIFPWEGSAKTLERLVSCPVTIEAIVLGDMIASVLLGVGITAVTMMPHRRTMPRRM